MAERTKKLIAGPMSFAEACTRLSNCDGIGYMLGGTQWHGSDRSVGSDGLTPEQRHYACLLQRVGPCRSFSLHHCWSLLEQMIDEGIVLFDGNGEEIQIQRMFVQ
jgi:hypothetical protein